MRFVNRAEELARVHRATDRGEAALVVVYGRRRIGKTRLLLEWLSGTGGLYTVADQSAPEIQRRYFAGAVATRLAGFADVDYPDWTALFARLARDAELAGWRGPLVIDELPYLVTTSPEIPSVLQRWLDHDARRARLIVGLAGSSQRMMQGLVLAADAPLYGRARELLDLRPIDPAFLGEVFHGRDPASLVELYTAWGGVPRYWELASEVEGDVFAQADQLALDPLGRASDPLTSGILKGPPQSFWHAPPRLGCRCPHQPRSFECSSCRRSMRDRKPWRLEEPTSCWQRLGTFSPDDPCRGPCDVK